MNCSIQSRFFFPFFLLSSFHFAQFCPEFRLLEGKGLFIRFLFDPFYCLTVLLQSRSLRYWRSTQVFLLTKSKV